MAFKTKFSSTFSLASSQEKERVLTSFASVEKLKGMQIPASVNLEDNRDLICIAYNGFVANQCNANDDGMDSATAAEIQGMFLHKPLDVEHDQSYVVGHTVATGWSNFPDSTPISTEEAVAIDAPVNFSLASVIYAAVNPSIANCVLESMDSSSDSYQSVSTSWEISFENYHIVLGSKNFNEAKIISDPAEILKYSSFLRCFGGSGRTPEGEFVGRKLVGPKETLIPIGFALTTNPAANVKGVTLISRASQAEIVEIVEENDANNVQENLDSSINQNDTEEKSEIFSVNIKDMKIEKLEDVYAAFADAEVSVAAKTVVQNHLADALKVAAEKWDAEKAELAKAAEEKAALAEKLAETEAKMAEINAKLDAIATEAARKEADEAFAARMEYISKEFKLSDEQKAIAAEELKALASDEAYEGWLKRFEVMNADKKASAAKPETVEEVLATASVSTASVPNGGSEEKDTIEALAKKVKITTQFSKK